MKLTPPRDVERLFSEMYQKAMDNTIVTEKSDPERILFLRASGLPFCPSNVIIKWCTSRMLRSVNMRMAYYTSVGHAVHHVMQSYLPKTAKFLANYHCLECGKKYPMSYSQECCGFETKHEEIDLNYKGVQGHIDGVWNCGEKLYIIDYKTCSLSGLAGKLRKPPLEYVRQLEAYAVLLKKQYNLDVDAGILVFVPRDDPSKAAPKQIQFGSSITDRLAADRKLHQRTMKASTLEELKDIMKTNCGKQYCDACAMDYKSKVRIVKSNLNLFPIK